MGRRRKEKGGRVGERRTDSMEEEEGGGVPVEGGRGRGNVKPHLHCHTHNAIIPVSLAELSPSW